MPFPFSPKSSSASPHSKASRIPIPQTLRHGSRQSHAEIHPPAPATKTSSPKTTLSSIPRVKTNGVTPGLESATQGTRTSFLSPKTLWSPSARHPGSPSSPTTPRQVAKFQLQDPGVVPGSPPATRRFRLSAPASTLDQSRAVDSPAGTRLGKSTVEQSRIPVPSSQARQARARQDTNLAAFDYPGPTPSHVVRPAAANSSLPTLGKAGRDGPTTTRDRDPDRGASSIDRDRTPTSCPAQHVAGTTSYMDPDFASIDHFVPDTPVSTCATVAPATYPPTTGLDREASISSHSCISIYSSASALARYRAQRYSSGCSSDHVSLPFASRCSSTTSFSSASSLARHRRVRSRPSTTRSSSTISDQQAEVGLVWEPDPESLELGSDPAEDLWREIEARLNGRYRSFNGGAAGRRETNERGQWVLTQTQVKTNVKARGGMIDHETCYDEGGGENVDRLPRSEEMIQQASEFTVSAYFDPDLSTPRPRPRPRSMTTSGSTSMTESSSSSIPYSSSISSIGMDGTVLFDMSAPLTLSRSSDASTPANTPCLVSGRIHREPRVRKGYSASSMGSRRMSRRRSDSTNAVVDQDLQRWSGRVTIGDEADLNLQASEPDEGVEALRPHAIARSTYSEQVIPGPSTSPHLEPLLRAFGAASAIENSEPEYHETCPAKESISTVQFPPNAGSPQLWQPVVTSSSPSPSSNPSPTSVKPPFHAIQPEPRSRSEGGLRRLDSQVIAARQSLSKYRHLSPTRTMDVSVSSSRIVEEVSPDVTTFPAQHELLDKFPRKWPKHGIDEDEVVSLKKERRTTPPPRATADCHPDSPRPSIPVYIHDGEVEELEHEAGLEGSAEKDEEEEVSYFVGKIGGLDFPTPQTREQGQGLGISIYSDTIYSFSTLVIDQPNVHPETQRGSIASSATSVSRPSDLDKSCTAVSNMGPDMGPTDPPGTEGSPNSTYRADEGKQCTPINLSDVAGREAWAMVMEKATEEEEEMLRVTDLDTGHQVELPIKQLKELWTM